MPIITAPPEALNEIAAMRTRRSKTFAMPAGKRRLIQKIAAVHYLDEADSQLKDIELVTEVEGGTGEIVANQLPYRFRLHTLGVGFDYQSRAGGMVRVTLMQIGGVAFNRTIPYVFTRNGSRVRFVDVAPDIDIVLEVGRVGMKTYRILKSASAARTFRWAVEYDAAGEALINKDRITGQDNLSKTAREGRLRRPCEVSVSNSAPQAVGGGRMRYFADETWTGRTRFRDPVTHVSSWVDEAMYPVEIDPDITEEIGATIDDGYEQDGVGNWLNNYNTLTSGRHLYNYQPGFRFQTIALDQGVTIDLAVLKVNVTGKYGNYGGTNLYGVDTDDAAAWSNTNKPQIQVKTTATVVGTRPTATGIKSYTITSIVQEIVDRAGWASGNDMSIFGLTYETGTPASRLTYIEDFTNAGTDEATLEIDFTAGGGFDAALFPHTAHYAAVTRKPRVVSF